MATAEPVTVQEIFLTRKQALKMLKKTLCSSNKMSKCRAAAETASK